MMMTMMMEVVVVKMIMVVVVEVVMVVTITLGPRMRAMGAQNDFTPAEGWDRAFKLQDSGFHLPAAAARRSGRILERSLAK